MSPRKCLTTTISAACLLLLMGNTTADGRHTFPSMDAVLDWNAIMVATVAGQNPFAQARFAAIAQLAVFDAVNAIERRYLPYLDEIAAPADASPASAVVAAAHTLLRTYFPAAAATLDAARSASLAQISDGDAKVAGIAVGEFAAARMIAHRANDGSAPPEFHLPSSADPGEWQLTPGCPAAGGVLKHWRNVTPFGLESASQFRSEPPPPLDGRWYARDFNEVKEVGGETSPARPQHKTDIARFYNAVLAVATWNPAVSQVAMAHKMSLSDRARLFALLNMAISDALVSVMETKYEYNLWRPATAIHNADLDSNPKTDADPAFQPLITAPCFPTYGSAHAAASYAARQVAEAFFGDRRVAISLSNAAAPGIVLHYDTFEEITDDIDDARVYGGIHFRFDQRAGARQGRSIGRWVHARHLRPVTGRTRD
jgi:hypothetical protein